MGILFTRHEYSGGLPVKSINSVILGTNRNRCIGYVMAIRSAFVLITMFMMVATTTDDARACASCGCTLSPDWDTLQASKEAGFKFDIRYDYLTQDQLRSGRNAISSGAASQVTNNGDPQEVEKYTKNNYVTLGIDYTSARNWGLNAQVPYIDRKHSTLGVNSDGNSPGNGAYDSRTSNLGDIKIMGRYQGFTEQHNIGILFGIKLPTGSYTQAGASTDPTNRGAVAQIDRGLQPGTGTTDVIIGAFFADSLRLDWGYFAQILYQQALDSKADYKPGNAVNVNLGIRYEGFAGFFPNLQLNFREVQSDSGENADTVSTGGTLVYLSPGISVPINSQVSVFGFVQVPLYQDVNGVQLVPQFTTSIGARYSF